MHLIRKSGPMLIALLFTAAVATVAAQITAGRPMPATVAVRVDAAGDLGKVPDRIFGTFLEPIDDSINNAFTKGSLNTNIRSGVGIMPNGNPVFIICTGINFYDFAALFKNKFGCRSALFLDGAISEMFVGLRQQQKLGDYSFGPMIAVMPLR